MTDPVTGVATAAVKWVSGLRFGYTVKRHNRVVAREYEDRWRWVRDQLQREGEALQAVEDEMQHRGLRQSGLRGQRESDVRRAFAQQWRDRKSAGERLIEDAQDAEGTAHGTYRRVRRKPWPEDPHGDQIASATSGWERTLERYGVA
jgi:hypothetical protein